MKYARIRNPNHPSQYYTSQHVQFAIREWRPFDDVEKPGIVTDPHLEIVDAIPDVVEDAQATNDELRAALRAAIVERDDVRDRLRRSGDLVGGLEAEIEVLKAATAAGTGTA